MTDIAIGIVEKNKTSELRGRFADFHGRQYFDLRTYVMMDATGDQVPTKKGRESHCRWKCCRTCLS